MHACWSKVNSQNQIQMPKHLRSIDTNFISIRKGFVLNLIFSFFYYFISQIIFILLSSRILCCFSKNINEIELIDNEYGDAATASVVASHDQHFDSNVNLPTLKTKNVVSDMEPIGDEISMFPERSYDRSKRALVFRPLFIYRQQQFRKRRLEERRRIDQQRHDNINRRTTTNLPFHTQFINRPNQLPNHYQHH